MRSQRSLSRQSKGIGVEATVASRASNRILPRRNCWSGAQNTTSKECQHSFVIVLTTSKEVWSLQSGFWPLCHPIKLGRTLSISRGKILNTVDPPLSAGPLRRKCQPGQVNRPDKWRLIDKAGSSI